MALADVLAALQTLAPTALTSSVSKLGAEIVRQLVSPALAKSRSFVARNENGLDVIELSADGSSPSAPRTLVVLLDFFAAHLLAASPILAAALPSLLAPSIQSLTIEHALAPALPDTLSTTALAIFQTRLDDALALEAAMDRSGLFGGATDAPRSIRRWVERAGEHWAERRASVASKALRSLIVRMDWEAVVVDWREPKPRCAVLCSDRGLALPGAVACCARLGPSSRDIADAFRARTSPLKRSSQPCVAALLIFFAERWTPALGYVAPECLTRVQSDRAADRLSCKVRWRFLGLGLATAIHGRRRCLCLDVDVR